MLYRYSTITALIQYNYKGYDYFNILTTNKTLICFKNNTFFRNFF